MKLVIDIPEKMFDELNTCKFPVQDTYRLCSIIENGQPVISPWAGEFRPFNTQN